MQEKPFYPASRHRTRPARTALLAATLLVVVAASEPRVLGLLANSLGVVVPAALGALAIGVPIALMIAKSRAPGRLLVLGTVTALVMLPLHVVSTAWMAALGGLGGAPGLLPGAAAPGEWLVGYRGAIVLHALAGAPWVALLGVAAFRAVDRRREEQAALEGNSARVLTRVTLRDATPALAAIGVLVAVLAASEIAITDLMRVRTFAEEVYTQAAAAQLLSGRFFSRGLIGLLGGAGLLAVAASTAMRVLFTEDTPRDAGSPRAPRPLPGRLDRVVRWLAFGLVAGLIAVPVASLIASAGTQIESTDAGVVRSWSFAKTLRSVASAPWQQRRELAVSGGWALAVATVGLTIAATVAWWGRSSRSRARAVVAVCAMALAIPGPLIGFLVLRLLNQPLDSPIGWLGDLYHTPVAPCLAQTFRVVPAVTLLLLPLARTVPTEVIDAARVDGAGAARRIATVILPLWWPALAAAWLAAFALSFGELSATVLVAPPGTPPLSVRLLTLLHSGVEDRVAAISLVLCLGYAILAAAVFRLLPVGKWLG